VFKKNGIMTTRTIKLIETTYLVFQIFWILNSITKEKRNPPNPLIIIDVIKYVSNWASISPLMIELITIK
jgi:hypothetical protein